MKATIPDQLLHIVILDISGIYTQIHNDGYFEPIELEQIQQQYSDKNKWKVIII